MSSGNFLFYILMFFGPLVALSSSNWVVCWVGVELSFLGLIPILVSENKGLGISSEATLKYFFIQAVGSGLLMCGGVMKFMFPFYINGGEYIFVMGLLLKLGVFPFHFWVPGVVGGLDWFPMFLILSWQKVSPFLFLVNLLENSPWLIKLVVILGGASAFVGAMIGLNQTKLGPLLGASSITHSGWVIVGAAWGNFWVYFIIYCACLLVLFIFLEKKESLLCGLMILSLSGLPPFFMFIGKWSVMKAVLILSSSLWVLALPLLGSVMSLFFYLKVFYSFYLEAEDSLSLKMASVCCSAILGFFGAMAIVGF